MRQGGEKSTCGLQTPKEETPNRVFSGYPSFPEYTEAAHGGSVLGFDTARGLQKSSRDEAWYVFLQDMHKIEGNSCMHYILYFLK